jgi:hypothetical protein
VSKKAPTSGIIDGGVILPDEHIGMDPDAFDTVVRGKGAPLIHYRAIRCPVGLVDPTDVRRPHADHAGCSNGFIYKAMGRVTATLTSNSTDKKNEDFGYFDGSTIQATFPRHYDSNENRRVLVRPFDRFYLEQEDILTGTWDLTQRRLDARADRFEFPAVKVEHLIDSAAVEYHQFTDFDLTPAGDLAWRVGKGPAVGTVFTVWYEYRPYWYVERLVHEIRLFPTHDFLSPDDIKMERLGFGAVLQREYVHRTQTPDVLAPAKTADRQKLPPDTGDPV